MTNKPDLTRVWAGSAPAANVEDPDITTPGKFAQGWVEEVPTFENFNFLQRLFTQALAHINENGIAVWDEETTYPVDALVKGSDGEIYISNVEQAGNDPTTDNGTNWESRFGTAAALDSQTSTGDETANRLMLTGAGGLLITPNQDNYDLNLPNLSSGFNVAFSSSFLNTPDFWSPNDRGWVINLGAEGSGNTAQIALDFDAGNNLAFRRRSEEDWLNIWHTGNLQLQDNSYDSDTSKIARVGMGGLLSNGKTATSSRDTSSKTHFWSGTDIDDLPDITSNWVGQTLYRSSQTAAYMAFALTRDRVFYETQNQDWNGLKEFWTNANLIHAQLETGGIEPRFTTPGSNLNPSQDGSWRNVSAVRLSGGDWGLWEKVQ